MLSVSLNFGCTLTSMICLSAFTSAWVMFTLEVVFPSVLDHMSSMPASLRTFAISLPAQSPVPLGAGMSLTFTDPHFPSTSKGIECGSLQLHCHDPHPLLILTRLIFAILTAFSRAGTVSLDLPYPIPTCPFLSPTTAHVAKLGLLPSLVFFCVCLKTLLCPPPNFPLDCPMSSRSDSSVGSSASTISASSITLSLLSIWSMLVISPSLTFFPASVFGFQASGSNVWSGLP